MKKTYKMQDLQCANCAAKMEDGIKKIEGVHDAKVNFMMQKLTIDADDGSFDTILDKAEKVCRRIESDCVIVR